MASIDFSVRGQPIESFFPVPGLRSGRCCLSLGIVGDRRNGRGLGWPSVDREPRVSPGIFHLGWPLASATPSANAASCARLLRATTALHPFHVTSREEAPAGIL